MNSNKMKNSNNVYLKQKILIAKIVNESLDDELIKRHIRQQSEAKKIREKFMKAEIEVRQSYRIKKIIIE